MLFMVVGHVGLEGGEDHRRSFVDLHAQAELAA
jgi:hypothetical protein